MTWNPNETTFGYFKRRFAIIEKRIDCGPQEAARIIVTCACLHNLAMSRGDMLVDNGRVVDLNNDIFTNLPLPEEVPRSYKIIREEGEFVRQCFIKEILVHDKNSSIVNNTFTYFQEILIVSFLSSNQFSELKVPFAFHEGQSPFFHRLLLVWHDCFHGWLTGWPSSRNFACSHTDERCKTALQMGIALVPSSVQLQTMSYQLWNKYI